MKKINRRKFLQGTALIGASALMLGGKHMPGIHLSNEFDLLIINGTIIDGNGTAQFTGDVGIKNGIIKAIGNLKNATADRVINAKGLKVVPGFIDIHTHTDLGVLRNPKGESKIRQGVTLEISGNCGGSFAPVSKTHFEDTMNRLNERYGVQVKGRTMGDFLNMLEQIDFSVNQATLVGLGTIRRICVGMDDREATPDELKRMEHEVRESIEGGAVGVATGLEYTPGSFASTEELIALCKVMPGHVKLYATHMRNEDDYAEEAVDEAIRIADESGSRLQMSHLKASGKSNWHKAESLLQKMDDAVTRGLEVHADRYTYVAYHTGLANLFPLWARDGGSKAFIERFGNKDDLMRMKEYSEQKVNNLDGGWEGVVISGIGSEEFEKYKGNSVKEIAEKIGVEPFQAAVDMITKSENSVSMVGFGMSEKSTEKILAHPRVMIASDASAHAPYPPMNNSIAHPRAYGTFPRAIAHYVRERNICSLEEMIKKMTSLPADKLHLKDRGRIEKDKFADVVLFDYNTIKDKATFTDSHQYPDGIPYVIVNGEVVIDKGEHTGKMPGKVIRS